MCVCVCLLSHHCTAPSTFHRWLCSTVLGASQHFPDINSQGEVMWIDPKCYSKIGRLQNTDVISQGEFTWIRPKCYSKTGRLQNTDVISQGEFTWICPKCYSKIGRLKKINSQGEFTWMCPKCYSKIGRLKKKLTSRVRVSSHECVWSVTAK